MGAKEKKKNASEEVDMTDIASMPNANVCLMQLAYSKFKDSATRQKIEQHVTQSLATNERIKQLTRQEILDYGKQKQIIVEGEDPQGRTLQQMMGQAAHDKIFEMTVLARGMKKQRLLRAQEELDAKDPEHAPHKLETDDG